MSIRHLASYIAEAPPTAGEMFGAGSIGVSGAGALGELVNPLADDTAIQIGGASYYESQEVGIAVGYGSVPSFSIYSPFVGLGTISISTVAAPNGEAVQIPGWADVFWWERIHALPNSIDAGRVNQDEFYTIEIFNSSRAQADIVQSYALTGPTGVEVADPTVPKHMPASGAFTFVVTIRSVGAPDVDNTYTLTLARWGDIAIPMTGQRIELWVFDPDWSGEVVEREIWNTNVVVAYDGSEQRIRLRSTPDREMEFTAAELSLTEAARMSAMLFANSSRLWAVPWWPDAVPPFENIASGSQFIECEPDGRLFTVGGSVIVWVSRSEWEIANIAAINYDGNSLWDVGLGRYKYGLTLSAPIASAYASSGCLVAPLMIGYLDDGTVIDRPSATTALAHLKFKVRMV